VSAVDLSLQRKRGREVLVPAQGLSRFFDSLVLKFPIIYTIANMNSIRQIQELNKRELENGMSVSSFLPL
jgi:hypothetical protein